MSIMPNIHWTTICCVMTLSVIQTSCRPALARNYVEVPVRLVLDTPRCEGHGLCEEAAPDLMHLDDAGDLVLDVDEVHAATADTARAAVRVCPVAALRLE